MNVPGPSRAPLPGQLTRAERVESTYEDDLQRLVEQFSLTEIDEIQRSFADMARDGGHLSDRDFALNDILQQAQTMAVVDQDRALAQLIAAGEDDVGLADQTPPQAPLAVPRPDNNGRPVAQQNAPRQRAAQAVRANAASSHSWGRWLSSMMGWALGDQRKSTPANLNTTGAARTPALNRLTGHDCVICQDPIRGAEVRAPCGHYYDIGCVTDLFQSATRDETLFPPRCCRQNIPFAQVQPHLSQTLITTFRAKETEFSTLKRVYCSSPTCSHFLGPLSEGLFAARIFLCPTAECGRRTCGRCRQQHSGDWTHACRPDADATQVLELSRASGWARCPGCSQMIELHLGCFHMTCRCRTEFCYLCHARWKTCHCPQWDEQRLMVAAEERVDAQLGIPQGARQNVPAQRARPVPVPAVPPPRAPVENPWENRARALARPPVPRPAPVAAPARTPAPAQMPPVQAHQPQPTPTHMRTNRDSNGAQPVMPVVRLPPHTPTPRTAQRQAPGPVPAATLARTSAPVQTPPVQAPRPQSILARTQTNWDSIIRRPHHQPTPTVISPSRTVSASASASAPSPPNRQMRRPKSIINTKREVMVREMMEKLRVDHECNHHGQWRYRRGGGICQTCGHHLPLYLFRCHGCEMLACNRCRRNRL